MLNEMRRQVAGSLPSRERPCWMEPDYKLANWLLLQVGREDRNAILVDCGAGVGALKHKIDSIHPNKILSIDIQQPATNQRAEVEVLDAITFPFVEGMIPVFIRPDHSGWVDSTLNRNIGTTKLSFYIGLEKNLEIDLNLVDSEYYVVKKIVNFDWVGPNGENIWAIVPRKMRAIELVLAEPHRYGTSWMVDLMHEVQDRNDYVYNKKKENVRIDPNMHIVVSVPQEASERDAINQIYLSNRPSRQALAELDTTEEERLRRAVLRSTANLERSTYIVKDHYDNDHTVEIVNLLLTAWSEELHDCGHFAGSDSSYEEEVEAIAWNPISRSGMRLYDDSAIHTDLILSTIVDGVPMRISDWQRCGGGWLRRFIEDLRVNDYVNRNMPPLIDPDQRPSLLSEPAVWLCGDITKTITGIVGRPKPNEPIRNGATIAVCPNGSVDYEPAARSAMAMIVGAGGTTCHLVTVLRPDGVPVVRCDNWDNFQDGDEIEIDSTTIRVLLRIH